MIKKKMGIIVVLVALIFSALALLSIEKTKNQLLKSDAVLHEANASYELKGTELIINENGTVDVSYKDGNVLKTYSLPIYLENNSKIMLTNNFAYYLPQSEYKFSQYKVEPLTNLYYQKDNGMIVFEKNNSTAKFYDGFLYDGGNLYIVLEDCILEYGDNQIELGKLSYVIVDMNYSVQFYNTKTDECKYESFDGIVTLKFDYYALNLGLDTYKYGDKESFMIANFEKLNNVFKGGN